MTPEILFEDNHLLVVNKPFGYLTHGDNTGDTSLEEILKQYIKDKYNKPGNVFLKSAHRLDRPVSGALMYARTSKAAERMAAQFRERKVDKKYWAIASKFPKDTEGRIEHFLWKDFKKNTVTWSSKQKEGMRKAVTQYRVLHDFAPRCLVELFPVTGRSHQLRVALRSMGCPILGDVKYQGPRISNPRAILLHSRCLQFMHPVKKELVSVLAPLPVLDEWREVKELLDSGAVLDEPFGVALR